jgi:acyl-CoA hydrolase
VDLVFSTYVNPMGTMFGGRVLELMDVNAGISCFRFARAMAITASTEPIDFHNPIFEGDIIEVKSRVVWTGRTSLVVRSEVHAESPRTGERRLCTIGHFNFVAVDDQNRPVPVPKLRVETELERQHWDEGVLVREQGNLRRSRPDFPKRDDPKRDKETD